jgi:hypothetical protein
MTAETLDLAAIARILSRARRAIALATFAGAILAAGAAFVFVKYRSDGVYTLGAIGAVEVKAPAPQYPARYQLKRGFGAPDLKVEYPRLDGEHFRQFIDKRRIAWTPTLAKTVRALDSPGTRADFLAPVYGTTRADLRELGEQSNLGESRALALQISAYASDPEAAKDTATLLGEFAGESLFASQAELLIASRHEQYESQQLAYENDLLKSRFNIAASADKIKTLQALKREFPDAGASDRQVVSVADGGSRYLSLVAQLIGTESGVADMRQDIATSERSATIAHLLADYYEKAQQLALERPVSQDLLKGLDKLIDALFTAAPQSSQGVREARNEAMLDLYALRALREHGLRFASGPTVGWRDPMRIAKITIAGAIVGGLLVAFIVLLRQAARDRATP